MDLEVNQTGQKTVYDVAQEAKTILDKVLDSKDEYSAFLVLILRKDGEGNMAMFDPNNRIPAILESLKNK